MKIIRQEKINGRYVYYLDETTPDGRLIDRRRYDCKTFPITTDKGIFVFIGDENDVIRPVPHAYVNEVRKMATLETRIKIGRLLNNFYMYCEMLGLDPCRLSNEGYEGFKHFLLGYDLEPIHGSNPCIRSVKYVRGALSVIHKFLSFYDYSVKAFTTDGHGDPELRENPRKALEPVLHFTPGQATKMAKEMAADGDRTTLMVFILGYQTGLRRGEILGITYRDICYKYDTYVDRETQRDTRAKIYYITIRNRPGEASSHRSKTLRRPANVRQANHSDFKNAYYEVEISEMLYVRLMNYYTDTHDACKVGSATAAKVEKATSVPGESGNHYVFYNIFRGACRLLSGQTTNNRLRKYYKREGLKLDNVSHAMRHSYAMFLVLYSKKPVDMKVVQKAMRHLSPISTLIYLNVPKERRHELINTHGVEMSAVFEDIKIAA